MPAWHTRNIRALEGRGRPCRYQASHSGYDRAPSWLPPSLLRQHFLPPFQAAIRAGAATVMSSYNTPVDTPSVISQTWTRKWLRGEAGFEGVLITDWTEIYNQIDWHRSAADSLEAVVQALVRSSLDMVRAILTSLPVPTLLTPAI
jgi:beta-glucosidase